jgi:hypothetical protein
LPGELHLDRSEADPDIPGVLVRADLIRERSSRKTGGNLGDVLAELPDLVDVDRYFEVVFDQHVIL